MFKQQERHRSERVAPCHMAKRPVQEPFSRPTWRPGLDSDVDLPLDSLDLSISDNQELPAETVP